MEIIFKTSAVEKFTGKIKPSNIMAKTKTVIGDSGILYGNIKFIKENNKMYIY